MNVKDKEECKIAKDAFGNICIAAPGFTARICYWRKV
jgi:hypothetical protein